MLLHLFIVILSLSASSWGLNEEKVEKDRLYSLSSSQSTSFFYDGDLKLGLFLHRFTSKERNDAIGVHLLSVSGLLLNNVRVSSDSLPRSTRMEIPKGSFKLGLYLNTSLEGELFYSFQSIDNANERRGVVESGGGVWNSLDGVPAPGNDNGIYGEMGVADAANQIGGRDSGGIWRLGSTIYVFGGLGYAASPASLGGLNDMWKFENDQWVWIAGRDSRWPNANLATDPGVPSPENYPSARLAFVYWQHDDKLWIYGGDESNVLLGDIWTFYPNGSGWAFLSDQPNSPPSLTHPGGRAYSSFWVREMSNEVWLFGGYVYNAERELISSSDLWSMNMDTLEWTVQSYRNSSTQDGVYGTQGTPSPNVYPGNRINAASWLSPEGDLYLFGGYLIQTGDHVRNDHWKYHVTLGMWEWVKGPSTVNGLGSYPSSLYQIESTNLPPAREFANVLQIRNEESTSMILQGGTRFFSSLDFFSDVWTFDGENWIWIGGDKVEDTPSDSLDFPQRRGGSLCTEGVLFGGFRGASRFVDLYEYEFATNWTLPLPTMEPTGTEVTDTSDGSQSQTDPSTTNEETSIPEVSKGFTKGVMIALVLLCLVPFYA